MKLDNLLKENSQWLRGTGANADIVISSRVRLARNLADVPFPNKADQKQNEKVITTVLKEVKKCELLKNSLVLNLQEIKPLDRHLLMERHLISIELAETRKSGAVVISEKEVISIMINEEDHLRLQAIQSGLQLMDAWQLIDQTDTALGKGIKFAYSQDWGYLTACPTNTGTGMRASLMLHLPCLVLSKQVGKVLQAIAKLGLAARGLYGEGTEPSGNFFQISNQITLGSSEEDMIDNIERVGKQVVAHEENARKFLLAKNRKQLEDKIFRAYGILQKARIISSAETLDLLSSLRLGIDLGLVKDANHHVVNELLMLTQPAHLQKIEGVELSPEERDIKRGDLIREKLHRR
jgi:protein arginine kinase